MSADFLLDSTGNTGDVLSDVFDLVEVRGMLSGGFAVRGPWVSRSAIEDPLKLFAMVRGRARLTTDGVDGPVELGPGDVAILRDRSWLELTGGSGDGPRAEVEAPVADPSLRLDERAGDNGSDVVIGGHVDLNPAGRALLLQALPPVAVVRAHVATDLRHSLDRLLDEATRGRAGAAFAIRQYAQILMLDVLRAYLDRADLPAGWLRGLTDARLRPALALLHAEPGRPWRLDELARSASMSRTSFAERFRTVAGVTPLAYLQRWRMLLARRALRGGDVRIGALASELGYASESAFSTAFKREVGESPLRYRSRVRPG
ncbi:AraC-like DNA-binding protein [Pseudonocardia sediminis]|uniref:AraC-like DNA-binding protein n=1 Tax=Pseudonocardia sediminis TaxID=1397368 RepID=A0A4Q7UVG5_PSEST|nr:AraC family transcriptional regulator [Pseudonocardia sediminis]RZT84928.1 AraC-like DNA-binding protein [Pseudonocardia sediminis]